MIRRLLPRWPIILIRTGFMLFAIACIESDHLPTETLLIGPALMVAGVAQIVILDSE